MTRLHVAIPLRWGDLDAYGHVNNVEILRLVEEARVRAFWRDPVGDSDFAPAALLDLDAASGTLSLVARLETEYLEPMPYTRESIDVETWLGSIGGASLHICFELYSPVSVSPRVLYARSAATIVTVSAATGRPTRIPRELRERWRPFLEAPLEFTRR